MPSKRPPITLASVLRESDTDWFLLRGPPAPDPGWIYRDFRPMPQAVWIALLELLGDEIKIVGANECQLPPAAMCRAQMWIGPTAQAAWSNYLQTNA